MDNTENSAKTNNERRVTGVMKRSLVFIFFVILVFCAFLIGRLVYLNNMDGEEYVRAVLAQQSGAASSIPAKRGMMTDRNGIVLAKSITRYNVIIDPAVILSQSYYYEPTLTALELVLGYDRETMEELIASRSKSSYVVYEENIDYTRVSSFNDYKASHKFVVGVWFEAKSGRIYPYDDLASHVIGFTHSDGTGAYGLEAYYDSELTGTDGVSYGYFDSTLNRQKEVYEAVDGNDLVLTLDYNIQSVVQSKVAEFLETTGCNNIGVIVMDPADASILALASNYEYNLNDPMTIVGDYPYEVLTNMTSEERTAARYAMWRNFCINNTFEPGSTFKTITVASALEEAIVSPDDRFNCIGYREVGGWRIGCNNKWGHGNITLAQALMKSCNCALMEIATRLGRDDFFKYQGLFGFGRKTGVDLPGEEKGILISKKNLNPTELCTSSFGTTFNVTMIQMAGAYASILNGGAYHTPHVVSEIRRSDGTLLKKTDTSAVRQTVSRTTAEFIRDSLYMTVESGTGTLAKVSGYIVGGKTGTAQKRPREEKKYIVSFVGFAPVEDPKVMVYVVVDEVHDPELSGSSSPATRMTSAIMKEILPYLNLYPNGKIEYAVDLSLIPDSENLDYIAEEDEGNPDVLPAGLDVEN